jgi:hypothetical protein
LTAYIARTKDEYEQGHGKVTVDYLLLKLELENKTVVLHAIHHA